MLAEIHLDPWLTVPAALVGAMWIAWYWMRLARGEVPPSRRRVRRLSLGIMVLTLPSVVRGLSFVNADVAPRDYMATWLVALGGLGLVILTVAIDMLNSARLLHREQKLEVEQATRQLAVAIREAERRGQDRSDAGADGS